MPAEMVKSVLQDFFAVECRLVGTENLEDLCSGRRDFHEDDEIFRMSVGESLALLANTVTVIAFVWDRLARYRSRRAAQRRRTERIEQIEAALLAEVPESAAMSRERRHALIAAVMSRQCA